MEVAGLQEQFLQFMLGSRTGFYKGVFSGLAGLSMVSHRGLVNHATAHSSDPLEEPQFRP